MTGPVTFRATIVQDGGACCLPLPLDPAPLFGRIRAPVVVALDGHGWRSTIAATGGPPCQPLSRANCTAAGVAGGQEVEATPTPDIAPPDDPARAMTAAARAGQDRMSSSHRRAHVAAIGGAKKPETRARRIAKAVAMLEGGA